MPCHSCQLCQPDRHPAARLKELPCRRPGGRQGEGRQRAPLVSSMPVRTQAEADPSGRVMWRLPSRTKLRGCRRGTRPGRRPCGPGEGAIGGAVGAHDVDGAVLDVGDAAAVGRPGGVELADGEQVLLVAVGDGGEQQPAAALRDGHRAAQGADRAGQGGALADQGELQLDHAGVLDPVADQVGDLQAEVGPADPGAAGHLDGGPVPAGLDRELDRAGGPVEAEGAGEPQPDHLGPGHVPERQGPHGPATRAAPARFRPGRGDQGLSNVAARPGPR
jgi:hypothetical protein